MCSRNVEASMEEECKAKADGQMTDQSSAAHEISDDSSTRLLWEDVVGVGKI